MTSITEGQLHAYVDGELRGAERAEFEAWLASHPEDAERVRAYAEQNVALRLSYNPLFEEPAPPALLAIRPRAWSRWAVAAGSCARGLGPGWVAGGGAVGPRMGPLPPRRRAA